jgi:hypothetical protein
MNDSVEPFEVGPGQIPDILADLRNFLQGLAKIAARKKAGIEAHHLMTCGPQDGRGDRADIAFVTSYQYPHAVVLV